MFSPVNFSFVSVSGNFGVALYIFYRTNCFIDRNCHGSFKNRLFDNRRKINFICEENPLLGYFFAY